MVALEPLQRLHNSAKELCEILGVTFRELDIRYISLREFELIGHKPEDLSVTYENVQARARTSIHSSIQQIERVGL